MAVQAARGQKRRFRNYRFFFFQLNGIFEQTRPCFCQLQDLIDDLPVLGRLLGRAGGVEQVAQLG